LFIPDPDTNFLSSGSRIQGSKRHRIPDPDPQHCWEVIPYQRFFTSGDEEAAQDADVALVLLRRPVAVEKVVECLDILGKLCQQF
jgi:hypothetical protein